MNNVMTKAAPTTLEQTVYGMFQEGTGAALCDSGGAYGRHWEHNKGKPIEAFQSEPEVSWSSWGDYTISTYHYLLKAAGIYLDETCREFNKLSCDDWDGDTYGISKAQSGWLADQGFTYAKSWNTYNDATSLSQVLQGTNLERDGEHYVLIQLHQGCDVRGGYTDARLFRKQAEFMGPEDVYGCVTRPDGSAVSVSNTWNGYSLTDENGNDPEIGEDDKVELDLSEFCY
jgi:hypothetical protein